MDGLLNSQQQAQQEPSQDGFFSPEENAESGLSFTSKQIEDGIKKEMDKQQVSQLDRVLAAGNKLLFGKDTHYKILDGFDGEGEQLSQQLAEGALGMTGIMIEKSGNTLPGNLIVPAATILLARASEFLNESGMAQVTDDVFEEAMHMYTVKLMDKHDPAFGEKVRQSGGGEQQSLNPTEQAGVARAQPGGLLNTSKGGM